MFENSASDCASDPSDGLNGGPSAGSSAGSSDALSDASSDDSSDCSSDDDVSDSVSERSAYSEASLSSDLSEWDSYDESSNGELSDDEDDEVCSAIKERRLKVRIHTLEMRCNRLKKKLAQTKEELVVERSKSSDMKKDLDTLMKIKVDEAEGKPQAIFFMDQMRNYYKKARGHRWSQTTIKHSIHFQAKSPGTYESIRKSELLLLPCRRTIQGYVGGREGETGFTSLVKERLALEIKRLSPQQKFISVMVDEVAIRPDLSYLKNSDQFIGQVDMGKMVPLSPRKRKMLANKMLTFAINGLSTSFCIPVAYYLVRELTAEDLRALVNQVLIELDVFGFHVVRIVTDNLAVNTKMFKLLNNGRELSYKIKHPIENRPDVFLSFDPCHVLKNVRN